MRIHQQKNATKKRTIIISILIAALVLGGIATYAILRPTQEQTKDNEQSVNYNPPTEQEIADSQNGKKNSSGLDNSETQSPSPSTTPGQSGNKKDVGVGVSFADIVNDKLEVRAFANNVIEGGTCTVTATQGSKKITKQAKAFIDASSTQCEALFIPKSELSTGKWSVFVEFSSSNAYGKSEIIEVTV